MILFFCCFSLILIFIITYTHQFYNNKIKILSANEDKHFQTIEELEKSIYDLRNQIVDKNDDTAKIITGFNEQLQKKSNDITKLTVENNFLKEEITNLKESSNQVNDLLKSEFKELANNILDVKISKFTDYNKEKIDQIINPFKEKLSDFKSKVEQINKEDIYRVASLKTEIEKLANLNSTLNQKTESLTNALRGDNKYQGNWGEFILESLLEKSGLREGHEYFKQKAIKSSEGKILKPDIIINLPGEKSIILDSKVSLLHFEKFVNTTEPKEREKFLKLHINSMIGHVDNLARKNYSLEYGIKNLDFVLMFIPIEPAFNAALELYPKIFGYAFDKNIVMVSPTTMFATIRTIASMWKTENQNRNVLEIARQGGALYDKIVGFLDTFKLFKKQLGTLEKTYSDAEKKLYDGKDNIVTKTERLRLLGAKTSKKLSEDHLQVPIESGKG